MADHLGEATLMTCSVQNCNQQFPKEMQRHHLETPDKAMAPLKRREGYESDLYQRKGAKRAKEKQQQQPAYARERVNADEELWQILSGLKEKSRTGGVIPRLEPQFTSLNRKGNTAAAYLCSAHTDHIATGFMDLGWGCGYRNCQMLMTFLQRQEEAGQSVLRQVADIAGLQLLLERAWRDGFDAQGAQQLSNRVYKTRKWIGTTEVYCMLAYLGIRCTILDFHRPTGPNNSHDRMFDWIQSYFESAIDENTRDKVVHLTDRPPLYLQHAGHSRTVIGIELLHDNKRNLIMFDPGRRMLRSYRRSSSSSSSSTPFTTDDTSSDDKPASFRTRLVAGWKGAPLPANLLRPFRVDAKAIAKNRQYQLLVLGEVVDERACGGCLSWNGDKGYLLDEREREAMKSVSSVGAL